MKLRIAPIAIAFAGIALSACPREQTPPHDAAPAAEPAVPASLPATATTAMPAPASTQPAPQASDPKLPQSGRMRAPPPEPDPLVPPPPPPPVDR